MNGEATADTGMKTCSVPLDLIPNAKPGDTFTVSDVADGNVTLQYASDDSGGDDGDKWGKDLAQAAPSDM